MKVTGSLFSACRYKSCWIIFFFIRKHQIESRFGILWAHVCIDSTGSNLSKRSFDEILHACVLGHFSRSVASVRLFMTPWTVACQVPLSLGILQARVLEWVAMLFMTPRTTASQASMSVTNSRSLLKLISMESIQPSHPLLSPSPPAFNPSQHQGLFKWVNSSHQVAKVLEFQLHHQSSQWTPRTDLL